MEIDDRITHVRKVVVSMSVSEVRSALLDYVMRAVSMPAHQRHATVITCENIHPLTVEITVDLNPPAQDGAP